MKGGILTRFRRFLLIGVLVLGLLLLVGGGGPIPPLPPGPGGGMTSVPGLPSPPPGPGELLFLGDGPVPYPCTPDPC